MSNRDVAVRLAEAGLYVFPCAVEKTPARGFLWQAWATNDPAEVAAIWSYYGAECAPAIACGASGLVVLDLDRKPGKADGVAAMDALLDGHGGHISECPVVATPSGGYHIYFRQPADRVLGNRTGALPAGIDVRGDGGYVLAPDAVLSTGEYYEQVQGAALLDAPVIPDWLTELIEAGRESDPLGCPGWGTPPRTAVAGAWNTRRATAYIESALNGWMNKLIVAPEGTRNNLLNDAVHYIAGLIACPTLAAATVSDGDVWRAMEFACQRNGYLASRKDGWPAFRATFRSAWLSGFAKPCRGPAPDPVDDAGEIRLRTKRA